VGAAAPGAEPGVLDVDPATPAADAYPLTALSYAATAPAALDADAGKAYASLLRYIATDGQHSGVANGQLPPGYAPLPEALRSQTLAAAARIEQDAGKPAASPSAALAASSGNRATAPGSAGVNGVQALIVVEPGAAGAGGSPAGGSVAGGSVAPTPASGGGSSRPRPGGITPTGRSTRDSPAAGPAPSRAAVATGAPAAAGAPSTPIRSPAPVPAPAVAPVPGATEPGGLATLTAAPRTAGEAVGFARYALLLALVVGALAAAAAPVLLRAARGSGGDATPG